MLDIIVTLLDHLSIFLESGFLQPLPHEGAGDFFGPSQMRIHALPPGELPGDSDSGSSSSLSSQNLDEEEVSSEEAENWQKNSPFLWIQFPHFELKIFIGKWSYITVLVISTQDSSVGVGLNMMMIPSWHFPKRNRGSTRKKSDLS